MGKGGDDISRYHLNFRYPVYLIAEKFHTYSVFRRACGEYLHHVSTHSELVSHKVHVVALILNGYQPTQKLLTGHFHALSQRDNVVSVFLGRTKGIYAGNGSHDYHITPFSQRKCGAVAELVYFVVYGAVLFDVSVGGGDISFRLIIVVI